MDMMHNPPHSGELLMDEVIAHLGLSITEAAEWLAMSRGPLSRVLNGKAGVSTARAWLTMQANYGLWRAMQHKQPLVRAL